MIDFSQYGGEEIPNTIDFSQYGGQEIKEEKKSMPSVWEYAKEQAKQLPLTAYHMALGIGDKIRQPLQESLRRPSFIGQVLPEFGATSKFLKENIPEYKPSAEGLGHDIGGYLMEYAPLLGVARPAISAGSQLLNKINTGLKLSPEILAKNALLEFMNGKNIEQNATELATRIGGSFLEKEAPIIKGYQDLEKRFGDKLIYPEEINYSGYGAAPKVEGALKSKKASSNEVGEMIYNPGNKASSRSISHEISYEDKNNILDNNSLVKKLQEKLTNHKSISHPYEEIGEEIYKPGKSISNTIKNPLYEKIPDISELSVEEIFNHQPTYKNARSFISKLKEDKRDFKSSIGKGDNVQENRRKLQLTNNKIKSLEKDTYNFLKKEDPKAAQYLKELNYKFATEVHPYRVKAPIRKLVQSMKEKKGIEGSEIKLNSLLNALNSPRSSASAQKILEDIGKKGINNLISQKLGKASDAKSFLESFKKLEDSHLSSYIPEKLKNTAANIEKALKRKKYLKYGSGALGLTAIGVPIGFHYSQGAS